MDYKRILVKVSGERLGGDVEGRVLDVPSIEEIALEIKALQDKGLQVAMTVGGGNILRGKQAAAAGVEEAQAHYMGMLATAFNALALQSALEKIGVQTRVMTGIEMHNVAEPFIRRRAIRHLEKGRVTIFAASGMPFITSDTAGALRAIEIGAEVYIKASKIDGIYTADPMKDKNAKHMAKIKYKDVLAEDLKVMDGSAIALCRDNNLPLMVCKIGEVLEALAGKAKCTIVSN